ncbi:hypothetical protein J3R83DRAFT_13529 [Lanmaoa asiatica]|nr:hypothetical protein J3R83DRAFT_13529 [Lanmaoa asiatica]
MASGESSNHQVARYDYMTGIYRSWEQDLASTPDIIGLFGDIIESSCTRNAPHCHAPMNLRQAVPETLGFKLAFFFAHIPTAPAMPRATEATSHRAWVWGWSW